MSGELIPLLKLHEYFQGVPDEVLQEVVGQARISHPTAGEVVHDVDAVLTTVNFVLRGRLKAMRVDARGVESIFRTIERGDQFGMMVGMLADTVPVRIVTLEPSTVLGLDHAAAMELTIRYEELRRLWLNTFAGKLRKHFFCTAPKRAPTMLALVHESPVTRPVARRLLGRLLELGETLAGFGDSDEWPDLPGVRFRPLCVDGRILDDETIRQTVTGWQDATRIVFDVSADMPLERAARLIQLVDRAVYFVPAGDSAAAGRRLRDLDAAGRGWRDKVSVAWLLPNGNPVGPVVPNLRELVRRDFKITESPRGRPWGRAPAGGLERLVHDLRGVRIGVALGGGAARGMSHLGVLKALEQGGIVVDEIAGTSAGALTGVVYASGLDCDYSASQFSADLRPPWIFRRLPRGDNWYLLYKYRRRQFDPMLRKYLHNWRLEQLPIPCLTVTVDLVSGKPVVRDRGDAVHAILESINLPVLSVPICHDGQALIDGGIVNNIPAEVLVSTGCNFVIAVSVTARMETKFWGITPGKPTSPATKPGLVTTLLRTLLVQNHNLNAPGVQPADAVIEPDVTRFQMTEFMRAQELAAVGEAAAVEQIPKLRQLLTRLDAPLFTPASRK